MPNACGINSDTPVTLTRTEVPTVIAPPKLACPKLVWAHRGSINQPTTATEAPTSDEKILLSGLRSVVGLPSAPHCWTVVSGRDPLRATIRTAEIAATTSGITNTMDLELENLVSAIATYHA